MRLVTLCTALILLASTVSAKDFPLTLRVTAVTSKTEASTIQKHGNSQDWDAYGHKIHTHATKETVEYDRVYLMKARVGDKVYSLQGNRLELGTYQGRFAHQHRQDGIELLISDHKGKQRTRFYEIVGETYAKN